MAYLFVDAGYLRPIVAAWGRDWFGRPDLELEPYNLGRNYLKCFYYDCAPEQLATETDADFEARSERAAAYIRRIKRADGWHVYEGTLRRHKGKLTQKEVDVAIAVDLMTHTHRKNTDSMSLIAGDLDFRPVVDAVVREGMYLRLIHGARASEGLMDAADARTEITPYLLHQWAPSDLQTAYPIPGLSSSPVRADYGALPLLEIGYRNADAVARLYRQADGVGLIVTSNLPDVEGRFAKQFLSVDGRSMDLSKKMFEYHCGGPLRWVAP